MTKSKKILTLIAFFMIGIVICIVILYTSKDPPVRSILRAVEPSPSVSSTGNVGCGIVTIAPDPEPCIAVQQIIAYTMFSNLVNSSQFKAWKRDNPGEYARLTSYMRVSTLPPAMLTFLGGALVNIVQAYWYARATDPIVWPPPNPPLDPNRKDKKPPTPPSNLEIK